MISLGYDYVVLWKKFHITFLWKLDYPFYHRQHKEALENLKRKQEEVEHTATKKQAEIIEQLKIKITDLEVDRNAQNERHQELILEMAEMKKYGPESIASDMEAPCDNLEIDQIMAKLEQDNKFLEDLEKQRSSKAVNKANSDSSSSSSSNNQRFVKEWVMKSPIFFLHLQIISMDLDDLWVLAKIQKNCTISFLNFDMIHERNVE